jgi:HAD superfamily hydrolase (TIGR01509 family)
MAMAIEAVIFDIGGVIVVTPDEAMDRLEASEGLEPGTMPRGPIDERRPPDHLRDLPWHDERLWRHEVVDVVDRLRGHYKLGLLTNDATAWQGAGWRETWPLTSQFDAVVDAADEGIRKPDARIYHRCAEALGVPPDACLFVDDLVVNVQAAEEAGMHGFHFRVTAPAESVALLLKVLGIA